MMLRLMPSNTAASISQSSFQLNRPSLCCIPSKLWSRQHLRSLTVMSAQGRFISDGEEARAIAASAKRVAVLGCKTEKQAEQPAFFVAEYLSSAGVDVIPVPVFYPDVTHILGKEVYRKVSDVPPPIDILDVFRKPSDLMPHLPDILASPQLPKCVWLQSGIRHPEFEQALVEAGCLVVADRCLKVDHAAGVAQGLGGGSKL